MFYSVILSLAVGAPLAAAPAPVLHGPGDPVVRVSLNDDGRYGVNQSARVRIRTRDDGYLLVLRTDVDGWVRVLYPTDPSEDHFIRGGHEIEVRGRGDREAFIASRHGGTGVVLAAVSEHPFDFQQFVRNDHWDYRALDSLRSESDPEAALVSVAQAMMGETHFEYDVASYTVSDGRDDYYPSRVAYYPPCYGCYRGGWSFGLGIGFGYRPYYAAGFYYDPFYDPFFYGSCWSDPFCYPFSYYRPWGYGYGYSPYRFAFYRHDPWRRSGFGFGYALYRPRFGGSVAYGYRNVSAYRGTAYRTYNGSAGYRAGSTVIRSAGRPGEGVSPRQRVANGEYVGVRSSGVGAREVRRPASSAERVSRRPDEGSGTRSSAPVRSGSSGGSYGGRERRGGGEARGGGGSYSGGGRSASSGSRGGGGGGGSGGRSPSSGGGGGGGGGRRR